jgi:glycosyltransferase involved in cell wall biosynthesis
VLEFVPSLIPDVSDDMERETASDGGRVVELLSVGRLDPEKAPQLLIEMMDELAARDPDHTYRLTIIGTGVLEDELREASRRHGDRVQMLGYMTFGPELLERYRRSDLFVHTARTEGSPQVLVEAQSRGLPVVGTDVGGVAAALLDGEAGVLVPPGDAGRLADAVMQLLADPEKRARVAAAGLEAARAKTMTSQADRVAQFLRGVQPLGKTRRSAAR